MRSDGCVRARRPWCTARAPIGLCLALGAVTCARTTAVRGPGSQRPSVTVTADPCAPVAARQRALWAALPRVEEGELVPENFSRCVRTPHGAWSLEVDTLRRDPQHTWLGHWSLAHYDARGGRVAVALSQPGDAAFEDLTTAPDNLDIDPPYRGLLLEESAFDYDGDGEPELALTLQHIRHEDSDPARGRVWTFRDGHITLYAPARAVDVARVEDVDADGRPDLRSVAPFARVAVALGSGFSYGVVGPEWVFHSLANGEFSSVDAVAVRAARVACPDAPGSALRTAVEVACARAWGLSPRDVDAAIQRGCPPVADDADDDPCPERTAMAEFARLSSPTPTTR